ncbi:MAG TPA: sugar kinase [Casimicrobiaceae bacterium]|nr:sugar kinase [Casimicrobiaceae bacterium]
MITTEGALDIVALGEAMVEFNQSRSTSPDAFLRGFGGDTSNMAVAAARLARGIASPLAVGYVTRVGDDAFGRLLLDLWRSEGVDTRGVAIDAQAATGVYFVTHGEAGHEFSYLRAGSAASRMHPDTLPHEMLRATRLLHVSGISLAISASACDAVLHAIGTAREGNAIVSFDPNLRLKLWPLPRARAVIRETMRACDVFLPSLDEARTLSGLERPEAIVDWAHAHGARIVALKCGTQGVWVSDAQSCRQVVGHVVGAVDATGAGDCFDGAFCVRLLAGDDPYAAARYANAAAALATTGFGAVAPLPDHAAVQALLQR